MRKLLVSVLLILMISSVTLAEENRVFDRPALEPAYEQAFQAAESAIQEIYPYNSRLYRSTADRLPDGGTQLTFCWIGSETPIFIVKVSANNICEVTYNDAYSAEEYYDGLRWKLDGLFRNWSITDKAVFAEVLPDLCELEEYRQLRKYPRYLPTEPYFSASILQHQYSIPDEDALPQEVALSRAQSALASQYHVGDAEMNDYTICPYYYVDQPENPLWVFRFWKRTSLLYKVSVDPYSGDVAVLEPEAIIQ